MDSGSGRGRPPGREPVTDGPQPGEVVHIAGQGGHFGHRHLGVESREAVPRALLTREHPHALGMQAQQARGEMSYVCVCLGCRGYVCVLC